MPFPLSRNPKSVCGWWFFSANSSVDARKKIRTAGQFPRKKLDPRFNKSTSGISKVKWKRMKRVSSFAMRERNSRAPLVILEENRYSMSHPNIKPWECFLINILDMSIVPVCVLLSTAAYTNLVTPAFYIPVDNIFCSIRLLRIHKAP